MPEITSAEAIQKAKEAAAAVEASRLVQIDASNRESEKRMIESFTAAIERAFSTDDDGQKKFIDITRIPVICHDIASMQRDIAAINDSLKWAVRIVIGGVIVAVLAQIIPHFTSALY